MSDPASIVYRYRKFTLGELKLVTRCEIHGYVTKPASLTPPAPATDVYFTTFALNEWDSKYCNGINWKQKLDVQRGAVLATELKNNSCKLAKWTIQSILAGVDVMRLGYVSRVTSNNNYSHQILSTQTFKPKEIAQQVTLSINNIWGIIKTISELILTQPDGMYIYIVIFMCI